MSLFTCVRVTTVFFLLFNREEMRSFRNQLQQKNFDRIHFKEQATQRNSSKET